MLPRNNHPALRVKCVFGIVFAAAVFLFSVSSAHSGDNPIIDFYQNHISAVDGNRCPMYPSCSAYCRHAVEKHGVITGWIMTLDRLVRCGRDEAKTAPQVQIESHRQIYDPVSANDFWWFNKDKKQ